MLSVHRRVNGRVIHTFILKHQWPLLSDLCYILQSQLFSQLNKSLFSLCFQSFIAVCVV